MDARSGRSIRPHLWETMRASLEGGDRVSATLFSSKYVSHLCLCLSDFSMEKRLFCRTISTGIDEEILVRCRVSVNSVSLQ